MRCMMLLNIAENIRVLQIAQWITRNYWNLWQRQYCVYDLTLTLNYGYVFHIVVFLAGSLKRLYAEHAIQTPRDSTRASETLVCLPVLVDFWIEKIEP